MANKTFYTYDEQIEKLEKEKQLIISDATEITRLLSFCMFPVL